MNKQSENDTIVIKRARKHSIGKNSVFFCLCVNVAFRHAQPYILNF